MMDDVRNWGMGEMNISDVRFDCDVLSVSPIVSRRSRICCVHHVYRYGCMGRCLFVCVCDVCHVGVISTMISWARLLCMEKFLKLACPTCLMCQRYILVGFWADTFASSLPCQVSKISVCIRYDGCATYLSMWQTNMDYVRFHRFVTRTYVCIRALSVSIYLYGYMAIWRFG